MKIISALFSLLFSTAIFSQEKIVVDPAAQSRTLSGSFTAIDITDGIELVLSQGATESIAVSTGDEKYIDQFKTEVENGVLKIYFDNKGINWSDNSRRKLRAYVSFKMIDKLTAAGGADVKLREITADELDMKFTSGATFNGKVHAKEITVDQNSGSMMNMSGSADKFKVEASSGAIFKGYELAAEFCEAKASSGASVRISVQKELSARASSGGGIHYKGSAMIKDIDISSGGIVKKS